MMRKLIILTFNVALYCGYLFCGSAYGTDTWKYAVIGDTRGVDTSTTTGVSQYLPAIAAKIVSLNPSAVFVAGDLINGDDFLPPATLVPYATQCSNWKTTQYGIGAVTDAGIPVYPVRGNHENNTLNIGAPIAELQQAYFNAFGSTVPQNGPNDSTNGNQVGYTWNLKTRNVRVISVDQYFYHSDTRQGTSYYYEIDQAWLNQQFTKTAPARYTFVMAHEPIYYLNSQGDFYGSINPDGSPNAQGIADRTVFWDSLGSNGVKMYLSSHIHDLLITSAKDSSLNNIYQSSTGNGGALPLGSASTIDPALTTAYSNYTDLGFALFTVTDTNITVNYYLYDYNAAAWSIAAGVNLPIVLLANPVNTWNTTSGNFSDAANWDIGAVPGAADTAVFNSGAGTSSTVNFTGDVTNNKLFVASGATSFNLNGHTYTVTTSTAIDGTENSTYQPYLSIAGNGSKLVTGALTMDAGAALSVGQGASVQCATLTVDGNSTITGNGSTVVTGAFTMDTGAALSVGQGASVQCAAMNVANNCTFMAQASSAASHSGQITCTGAATIPASTSVLLDVKGYIPNGSQFTIVNGTTGTGVKGGITATATSPVFSIISNPSDSKDLTITAIRAHPYNTLASTANGSAVGSALESIGSSATGDMLTVLNALDSMTSSKQISDNLESMHPDMSSGDMEGTQAITNQFLSSISSRIGFVRNGLTETGISTGDMFQGTGVWFQGLGSHALQDTRKGIEGFQYNTFGTMVGADKIIGDHVRAGLAGGYGYADIKSKTPGSPQTGVNCFQGTIYGSYDSTSLSKAREKGKYSEKAVRTQGENLWYVDGMFGVTQNNYDSRRQIYLGDSMRVANAAHYGQQYTAQMESGYTMVFKKTKALEITPFALLQYSYLRMNRYSETGADALDLTVKGEGFNSFTQGLGTKLAYPILSDKYGTFIPAVKCAWLYDYMGETFVRTASFDGGGPSFQTTGVRPSQHGMLMGASIVFLNKGNMTVSGNYDWEIKDRFGSHTYYGTVRMDF